MTATMDRSLLTKRRFVDAVGEALARGDGFAAGKLGVTERSILRYPLVLADEADRRRVSAFEQALRYRASGAAGLFPATPGFLRRFAEAFAADVRALDAIGLFPHEEPLASQFELLASHGARGQVMDFLDQEPDRSHPADESRCYLPHLRGRRLLLVSGFGDLLGRRANRETFEAVWSKTGKPWFHPARVEALEIPLGWSATTQASYTTSLDLLGEIMGRLAELDFDVALIGGGGLGIPLAAAVKRQGRAAISLGGHIQVLFGVKGERWNGSAWWRERYFNDAWIDLPDRYRPEPGRTYENYW
jgi:hypothetical protein